MANTNNGLNIDSVKNIWNGIDWKKVRTGALIVGGVAAFIGACASDQLSKQQIEDSTKRNVKEYIEGLAKEAANAHHEMTK